jgi:hypothetical protein
MAPLQSEKALEAEDWGTFQRVFRQLNFDGLSVVVITHSDGSPPMLSSVDVRSPHWEIAGPLRVGQPASDFFSLVGKGKVGDGVWNISQVGPSELLLKVEDGRIAAIQYACYTG